MEVDQSLGSARSPLEPVVVAAAVLVLEVLVAAEPVALPPVLATAVVACLFRCTPSAPDVWFLANLARRFAGLRAASA